MGSDITKHFKKSKVLVIGDIMIDCYLYGKVTRISPEAPVPIMDIVSKEHRLGGAANVALNLQALGATVFLCGMIGNDVKGALFQSLLEKNRLHTGTLLISNERKTTVKYRIIGNRSQMLRVDDEDTYPLSNEDKKKLIETVVNTIENNDIQAIIFEDYEKGLLDKESIETIIQYARKKKIIIAVDPKKNNFHYYENVTLFKPNLHELCNALPELQQPIDKEQFQDAVRRYAEEHHIDYLMTTLSENGITLFDRKNVQRYQYPAYLRNISDVSGAGDTVIAIATLCLCADMALSDVVQIANLAGGIVCEYAGVVPVNVQQLNEEINKWLPALL